MTKDKIKQGKWYETKLGVGKCTRAGGTFPWSAMIDIKLPFLRGKLNFVPRDVLREVDAPKTPAAMPTRCDVCGASPRTHACDEEACEPTTPEDGPCVREVPS